jgi:hypothetical protein
MPSPLTAPPAFGGVALRMRSDGATDRPANDHRLPARHRRAFLFQVTTMPDILASSLEMEARQC